MHAETTILFLLRIEIRMYLISHGRGHACVPGLPSHSPVRVSSSSLSFRLAKTVVASPLRIVIYHPSFLPRPRSFRVMGDRDEGSPASSAADTPPPSAVPSTSGLPSVSVDSVRRVIQEEVRAALAGVSRPSSTMPTTPAPSSSSTTSSSGK